jgi:hypothetical protein
LVAANSVPPAPLCPYPVSVCGTVLSLVISSHFLQMKVLYDECVEFFRNNLQAIVSSPVDTACLPPAICAHIAGPIPDSTLVALEVCGWGAGVALCGCLGLVGLSCWALSPLLVVPYC